MRLGALRALFPRPAPVLVARLQSRKNKVGVVLLERELKKGSQLFDVWHYQTVEGPRGFEHQKARLCAIQFNVVGLRASDGVIYDDHGGNGQHGRQQQRCGRTKRPTSHQLTECVATGARVLWEGAIYLRCDARNEEGQASLRDRVPHRRGEENCGAKDFGQR